MKYLLLFLFSVALFSCQDEDGPAKEDSGLIAYFPLDSSFVDASGNDRLLQVNGEPEFTEGVTDKPATAIILDGEDDYLVGSIGNLETFSISMWLESYRYIVGEWPHWRSTVFDYSNEQVHGCIDGISGATQLNCKMDTMRIEGPELGDGSKWFHMYIAVGNEVKIYLNGNLKSTFSLQEPLTFKSDDIYIGRAANDEEIELTYFYGKMDEIRIYNRILDQDEIDEISAKQ